MYCALIAQISTAVSMEFRLWPPLLSDQHTIWLWCTFRAVRACDFYLEYTFGKFINNKQFINHAQTDTNSMHIVISKLYTKPGHKENQYWIAHQLREMCVYIAMIISPI